MGEEPRGARGGGRSRGTAAAPLRPACLPLLMSSGSSCACTTAADALRASLPCSAHLAQRVPLALVCHWQLEHQSRNLGHLRWHIQGLTAGLRNGTAGAN